MPVLMRADSEAADVPVADSKYEVLGVAFHAVQIGDVIRQMEAWIGAPTQAHFVCVSNVHSVMESRHDPAFKEALNASDLNVPDGMPVIWVGRLREHQLPRRVYGPELFEQFLRDTQGKGYRHFFYGGSPTALDRLTRRLQERFPDVRIAGAYSPPFRPLTPDEDCRVIEMINDARPDVVWVGLGCPKQELWMRAHCRSLNVPVMVGIGQAFNIYAGNLRQAPRWMREHGLEWLFRLCLEPRRLWRRYLVYNTLFLIFLLLNSVGLKEFD